MTDTKTITWAECQFLCDAIREERDQKQRDYEQLKEAFHVSAEALILSQECHAESRKLVAELNGQTDQLKADVERLNAENDRIVAGRAAAIRDQGRALDLYSKTKDELAKAYGRFKSELQIEIDRAHEAMERYGEAKAQLAATEQALHFLQRESAELRRKYETHCGYWDGPLMKIANAAVALQIACGAIVRLEATNARDGYFFDARSILRSAEADAHLALDDAVNEYRKLTEGQNDRIQTA